MGKTWQEMSEREKVTLMGELLGRDWFERPNYIKDHNAVAQVRAEVERRWMVDLFIEALIDVCGLRYRIIDTSLMWVFMSITPDQQCQAFCRACGAKV